MAIRVAQLGTGNVGIHALTALITNPDYELTGVWVSSDAKAGKDAGEIAGLDISTGILATTDLGAVLATAHTAYNLRVLRVPPADPPIVAERVSVLVPARDEAARIEPCIRALLASEGVRDLEVLVLDDASTDGTADVVRRAAQGDPRLRVIDGSDQPLPSGWLGKTWACARLVETATGTVLLFVDADVVVAPRGVAATVALLRMSGLDLVSPYPRQLADGVPEGNPWAGFGPLQPYLDDPIVEEIWIKVRL